MGWFSRFLIWIGLAPVTCPACGDKDGEWTKTSRGQSLLTGRPVGVFGKGWECSECGWKTGEEVRR